MSRARHRRQMPPRRLQTRVLGGVLFVVGIVLGGVNPFDAAPAARLNVQPTVAPATASTPMPRTTATVPQAPESTSVRLTTTPVRPALQGPFRSCGEALAAGLVLPFTRAVAVWNPALDRDRDGKACE